MRFDQFCEMMGIDMDAEESKELYEDYIHSAVDNRDKFNVQCFICRNFFNIWCKFREYKQEEDGDDDVSYWKRSFSACYYIGTNKDASGKIIAPKDTCSKFKKMYIPNGKEGTWYYTSEHWRNISARRKEVDGYKCRICGIPESPFNPIDTHHLTYDRYGHENIDDLICMCRACHMKLHQKRDEAKMINQRLETISQIMDDFDNNKQMIGCL